MNSQKRSKALLLGMVSCALIVGFSDTARAQTVSVSNQVVTFSNVPSGAVSSQQIQVTSSSGITTVCTNITNTPAWLTVGPQGCSNTPVTYTITANAAGLTVGQQYTGTFSIYVNGNTSSSTTVTVNLGVTGTSALSGNPANLSFTAVAGTLEQYVATQTVAISSSIGALNYTATPSTTDGANWLVVFNSTGNTSGSNVMTVGVNPANLSANTYHGSILVQSQSTSDSVAIPVTLTVSSATTLSVTPSTLEPFLYQIGGTVPASQSLMISSSNNTSVDYTVQMSPQASWLTFPLTGSTGVNGAAVAEPFTVNPSGLASGSYSTQVTITNTSTGATVGPITVQMVISNNPLLSVSSNSLAYVAQFGSGISPSPQTVTVTTVGTGNAAVGFTYSSDSSWLSATSSGSATPATLTITVNPNALAVGSYNGNIVIRPSNGDDYSLDIQVSLTVSNAAQITAGPAALLFSFENVDAAPTAQVVRLLATANQAVSFTATPSVTPTNNCPAGWLSVSTSASTTPANITASVSTTGLGLGTCTGSITVSYGSGASISIPVTLNVSATALLAVSMPLNFGVVSASQGTGQVPLVINLTSTDPSTQVTGISINASSNGSSPWLFISQSSLQTPQQLTVQIEPGTLSPGTYSGTISINAPSANLPSGTFTVPVTLTVTSTLTVTASGLGSNNSLSFAQAQGGALPAAQVVTLTGSASGAQFTSSIPSSSVCSWLTLTPTSGAIATSGTAVSVGVQTPATGALAQGSYPCQFTLNFLNAATSSLTVTATLTVGSSETFTVSPQSLTFSYQLGGAAPASQQIQVTGTPNAVNFTVGTTSSGGWLSTSAGTGTLATPQTLTVSINPADIPSASLAAGKSVTGMVSISAPSITSSQTFVSVTVNITAPPAPQMSTLFNSANINGFGPIAPGELITIKGATLGPATPASFAVSSGTVSNTLSGVQVLFDSTPGTPTYVSATQINVIVPWEVAGRSQTVITTTYNGVASTGSFTYTVVSATPAFYTLNATGTGQAAALNADYSINGPAAGVVVNGTTIATKPATAGSEIAIYGTGGGVTNPGGTDGLVTPTTSLFPLAGAAGVTATVGGQPATVYFVGAAPGEVPGVFQINLGLPAGVTGDSLPVTITVNGTTSYAGPTISVQ